MKNRNWNNLKEIRNKSPKIRVDGFKIIGSKSLELLHIKIAKKALHCLPMNNIVCLHEFAIFINHKAKSGKVNVTYRRLRTVL